MGVIKKASNLEGIFMNLSYYFVRRYTKGQKKRAFMYLNDEVADTLSCVHLEAEKIGLSTIFFYTIGDIKKAKRILMTPFDTPKRSFIKQYTYYPFDEKRNYKNEKKNICFLILEKIALLLVLLSIVWLIPVGHKLLILLVLFIVISCLHDRSIGSVPNFNKSTASLSLLLHMAKQKQDDIAYVFLDQTAENYTGLKLFLKKYEKELRSKDLLYMDCLASGEQLVMASLDSLKDNISEAIVTKRICFRTGEEPGVFQINKNLKMLHSGRFINDVLCVNNTRSKKDCSIDVKRLKVIEEWLLK